MLKQTTSNIMMVRPIHFAFNPETAVNNAFQLQADKDELDQVATKAQEEFDTFVGKLREQGISVFVFEDTADPHTPDSVFPNNWITFHQDGTLVTYPMYAPTRRKERRDDIVNNIEGQFQVEKRIHLEEYESSGIYLEGTGSLILDRINKIAYACVSERTNEKILDDYCAQLGYKKILFSALDAKGMDIYHTNVMMCMGDTFVVLCSECVPEGEAKDLLLQTLKDTDKELIDIRLDQVERFAGNMLQVENEEGKTFLVMSEQAFKALDKEQVQQIEKHSTPLYSPLYTIEKLGGGSARCMLAEIFLPPSKS